MTFRYRLVKDCGVEMGTITPLVDDYPADGFATAKEADTWAVAHDLDWRWYIQPMPEVAP